MGLAQVPNLQSIAGHDRKHEGRVAVAAPMHESESKRPVVRLAQDDFDGVYDDRPAPAAAAA